MVERNYLTTGLPQTDLTVLSALRDGISLLRQYPYLLNYVFMDLLHPPLLTKYGAAELNKIKRWFAENELKVVYGSFLETKTPPPFVSIKVVSSNESKALKGLGDQNEITWDEEGENIDNKEVYPQPYALYGPFSPSYDSTTGIMTLPEGFSTNGFFAGEYIQSQSGQLYLIDSIIDDLTFTIPTGILDNFTQCSVVFADPNPGVFYEFHFLDETYQIMCVTGPNQAPLFWLTSIIRFILFRNRNELLEKNNITLSTIAMGETQMLEVEETNVQLITQPIIMSATSECRILTDVSQKIRGVRPIEINYLPVGSTVIQRTDIEE